MLPIAWIVLKREKGHFPDKLHLQVIHQVQKLVPPKAQVIFLGDGEFDGVNLRCLVNQWKWKYVLRTEKNINLS